MTETGSAAGGIAALLLGGFVFLTVGGTVAEATSSPLFIDLRLWGLIYIIAAVALGVGAVAVALRAIFS